MTTTTIAKTKQQKIALCARYLEAQGFFCFVSMIGPQDVAKAMNVCQATLRNWTNVGSETYIKDFPRRYHMGGTTRYKASEVHAWIEAQAQCPHAAASAPQTPEPAIVDKYISVEQFNRTFPVSTEATTA